MFQVGENVLVHRLGSSALKFPLPGTIVKHSNLSTKSSILEFQVATSKGAIIWCPGSHLSRYVIQEEWLAV